MALTEDSACRGGCHLFLGPVDTKMAKILSEGMRVLADYPGIVTRIHADQEAAAREAKASEHGQ